jgi:hypothetical protein
LATKFYQDLVSLTVASKQNPLQAITAAMPGFIEQFTLFNTDIGKRRPFSHNLLKTSPFYPSTSDMG